MTLAKPNSGVSTIEWLRRAMIFLCALAVALSLAWHGNSCGHDFDFHIQSWLAVAQQWHHGMFYPKWIEAANYGAGEPRFVFYPPLSWMLGAILGIVLGWPAAPIAFTLIVLTACGVSMNKLAREWLTPNAATVAACAYILNPYELFVAYERTAYGELAAGIWLPLIILYALRAPTNSGSPGPADALSPRLTLVLFTKSAVPLALAIAVVWLTNAPAAVMACYTLAVMTIWKSITQKQWQPILNAATSLILGLGLASFYIVPAAYERRWVDIARAIGPGMRIEDSFLFGHTGESFHDQVLSAASWIFVTMAATSATSAWIFWKRKTAQHLFVPLSVTVVALFVLQSPWSDILWRFAPELKFLQFPWRWSLLLSIVFALSLGAAAMMRSTGRAEEKLRFHAAVILIAAMAAVSLGTWLFRQPCDEEDVVSAQVAVFQAGTGFEGTDEYTPIGADNTLVQQNLPQIRVLNSADAETAPNPATEGQNNPTYASTLQDQIAADITFEQWLSEHKTFTITTQAPGFAVLRLIDYPAWQVRANGTQVLNRPHRDDGLMTIPIQPGRPTHVDVKYAATPDVWWGRGLSIGSLVALLGLVLAEQERREVI